MTGQPDVHTAADRCPPDEHHWIADTRMCDAKERLVCIRCGAEQWQERGGHVPPWPPEYERM